MAEITVNVTSNRQGSVLKTGSAAQDWDDVINSSSGTTVSSGVNQSIAIRAQSFVDRGSNETFSCTRSFFYFDCSSLPSGATVTAGTFTVNGVGNSGTNAVTLIESNKAFGTNGGSALSVNDFDTAAFEDQFSSDLRGSDTLNTWNAGTGNSGENDFQLNSTAIGKINNSNPKQLVCALVNYNFDYIEDSPGSSTSATNGVYFNTSGSFMPKLQLVYEVAGYGNTINGITAAAASAFTLWQVNSINLQGTETPQADDVNGIV